MNIESFRDPAGYLAVRDTGIYRVVRPSGRRNWEIYWTNPVLRRLRAEGKVVDAATPGAGDAAVAELAADAGECGLVARHDRVEFVSYPHEWPAAMLEAAGDLTLDLALELLRDDVILKDATPFNVLFRDADPVFVDALSFERRDPANALWLAEAQFLRTFVYPLTLYRRLGLLPSSVFLAGREGLTAEQVYRSLPPWSRCAPRHLLGVTLPALLGRRADEGAPSGRAKAALTVGANADPAEKTRYILERMLKRLRWMLRSAGDTRSCAGALWTDYGRRTHYGGEATEAKHNFVARCLARAMPKWVLDIGCNNGEFTRLAARKANHVVAVDLEPEVVDEVWRTARSERLPILPLVQNLAMPTPAAGWDNRESAGFLDRCAGRFDCVMMLAVVHHLLVTDRIPLARIFDVIARCCTRHLIIEHVGPADPMFRTICRGRDKLFEGLDETAFERALSARFEVIERAPLPGMERTLFFAVRRPENRGGALI